MTDIFNMLIEALNRNEFEYALKGEREYALPTPYMCPVSELPTDWSKLLEEGIYKIYKLEPSYKIDQILEDSLLRIAKDVIGIYSSLNIFWIQLMKEEYKVSPFVLRKERIIELLSKKIVENKQKFIKDKRWMGENQEKGLWGEIKRICNIIHEDYRIKII